MAEYLIRGQMILAVMAPETVHGLAQNQGQELELEWDR